MPDVNIISVNDIPCCPHIGREPCCDRLRFTYRLQNRVRDVTVEFVIIAELERCPGPLSLSDVVYSTTLLPGEKVRLYTSNRNNRFTFDSESKVTYRHEQASEETYYMTSMDRFMSDLTVNEQQTGGASSDSSFETEGSVSNWTSAIFGRPNVRASGDFSSESSFDFLRELSSHAEASHERSAAGTRAANSIAVGEVQSRAHAEGESEDAFEASTRVFENKNQCHSVTYFAYQLMKQQTIRFRVVTIRRRILDPVADTAVEVRPLRPVAQVAVIPNGLLATAKDRLEVETTARTSAVAQQVGLIGPAGASAASFGATGNIAAISQRIQLARPQLQERPLPAEVRQEALKRVDEELVKAGILDRVGGDIRDEVRAELGFERTTCLPTQAIVVKGCIDDCNTCEPARKRRIELELQRMELENKLMARQVELLEKSQEYRCCGSTKVSDDEEA